MIGRSWLSVANKSKGDFQVLSHAASRPNVMTDRPIRRVHRDLSSRSSEQKLIELVRAEADDVYGPNLLL
jgi:hypothetical protein